MMMDLSKAICYASDETYKHRLAMKAASVWAKLRDPEEEACYDCPTKVPVRCERFFAVLQTKESERQRRRAEQIKAARDHAEANYKEALLSHLDKSCCRTRISTGEVECDRKHCLEAQRAATRAKSARVLRQLHEDGHEEAQLSVAQLLATDGLSSHHHPHKPCRDGLLPLLSTECVSESVIHHVLSKHNMQREAIDKYLDRAGLSLSQMVVSSMGVKTTIGKKTADWWMSHISKTKEQPGRRLQTKPRKKSRPMKTDAGVREFKRGVKQYLNASAHHARKLHVLGSKKVTGRYPKPASIVDTVSAIVSQQGSLLSTVLNGGKSLNDVISRRPKIFKQKEIAATPKPAAKHIKGFFDHVETLVNQGRRLDEGYGNGIHIPPTAPDWILKMDWPGILAESHRVAGILRNRDTEIHNHARRLQALPSGPVAHPTGHALLDLNVPPSAVGNALRRLAAWITDATYDHTFAETVRKLPRTTESEPAHIIDAVKQGAHPLFAIKQHIEHTSAHTSNRRQLAEGIFGGIALLPATTNAPIVSRYGSYPNSGGGDIFKGIARWFLMDVALCYLYPINNEAETDDFGDGTPIKSHRSNRLCFPGIPFIPPKGTKFRATVGLPADYDFEKLEYATACNTETMKATLQTIGQPNDFTYTPVGLMLRFAEGVDSLRNLARSSEDKLTVDERAAALVCATSQLGGLLFTIIASCFALFSLAFVPVFVSCGVCCCQVFYATQRRRNAPKKRAGYRPAQTVEG